MKILILLIILFCYSLVIPVTYSQNFWQQTNGPFGGNISRNCLAVNSKNNIFVLTQEGLNRSSNEGKTWDIINTQFNALNNVSMIISADDILIIATQNDIYYSRDNGDSWIKIFSNSYGITAFCVTFNETLFVAVNVSNDWHSNTSQIMMSPDFGKNWSIVCNDLNLTQVTSLTVSKNNFVFAGTQSYVFRSTDNGNSWTRFLINKNLSIINSMVSDSNFIYCASRFIGIFISKDYGETWNLMNSSQIFTDSLSIISLLKSDDYILVGTTNGVYRSYDEGQTWQEIMNGINSNNTINSLIVDKNGGIWIGTDGGGIFYSTNSGDTWKQINLINSAVQSIALNSKGEIFAGTAGGGIYCSSDKGNNWSPKGLSNLLISSIAINSDNKIFVGGLPNSALIRNCLFSSTDDGNSWQVVNIPFYGNINSIKINSKGYIYIATYGEGIYVSSDGGTNWTQKNNGLSSPWVQSLIINSKNEIFAGTDGYGICMSSDNGDYWTQIGFPSLGIVSLGVNSDDSIFVGTYNGGNYNFYISKEDGYHWQQVDSGLSNNKILTFTEDSNDNIYAGTMYGGVYILYKDSSQWEPINTGLLNKYITSLTFDKNGYLYAGSIGSGVFRTVNPIITRVRIDNFNKVNSYSLFQNYPNPFNPTTIIKYSIPKTSFVTLKVYDILGRNVETLINKEAQQGNYEVEFSAQGGSTSGGNGKNLPSGIYFYRIKAGSYTSVKKMILLK